MTSALAPALSPRRGRIVRRFFENLYDWIDRMFIRKAKNIPKLFPLLGERIKGEGGRKHIYSEYVEEAKSKTGNPLVGLPVIREYSVV